MRRSLTLLCLIAWYMAAPGSSRQSTEIYGEWSSPINVGPPVNTEYNDTYAILSRDELTMYFTSDRPEGLGGDDLWFATRESADAPWGEPQNMRALNTSALDSLAVLSSDEHVMFFHSTRPGGCGAGDIWMTRRHNRRSQEWQPPTKWDVCSIRPQRKPHLFSSRTLKPDKSRCSTAATASPSRRLRRLCERRGRRRLLRAGSAGAGIQQPQARYAHFHKERWPGGVHHIEPDGGQGLIDIWTSTRETLSDMWSTPVDLPSPVNSASDDGSPWLSRDGTTLYFFSTRALGYGKRDIWCTTRVKMPRGEQHSNDDRQVLEPDDCAWPGQVTELSAATVAVEQRRHLTAAVPDVCPDADRHRCGSTQQQPAWYVKAGLKSAGSSLFFVRW